MLDKYLPVIGIVGLGLLVTGYFVFTAPQEAARKDSLTFSNTARWESEYLAFAESSTRYPSQLFSSISLPPPPKNSSPEVARELAILHSYVALRTPKEIQDFLMEGSLLTLYIGGHTLAEYMGGQKFPATTELLKDSFHDVTVIEMQQKKKFDRVRPNVLDPTLETISVVPGHPAYPSYRSTEVHFLAYVFSELAPARKEEFVARADQISKNCQIAGNQYPSDTAGGVLLAQQFFESLLRDARFQRLLLAARKEWAANGLTMSPPSSVPTNH